MRTALTRSVMRVVLHRGFRGSRQGGQDLNGFDDVAVDGGGTNPGTRRELSQG
ncbi:hypothetical protein [Streptomyces radicis]|uniref:hypothetical protein n=1 Tax=Streptomyces radicis TaxID=1750517 RepID=UPI0038B50B07